VWITDQRGLGSMGCAAANDGDATIGALPIEYPQAVTVASVADRRRQPGRDERGDGAAHRAERDGVVT
jgi:hypothetical protein